MNPEIEKIRQERIKLEKENDALLKKIHNQLEGIKKREDEINSVLRKNLGR